MRKRVVPLALTVSFIASVGHADWQWSELVRPSTSSGTAYPLDALSRGIEPEVRRLRCDTSELVAYRGTALRYRGPVWVHPAFIPIVARFESIVRELAVAHYGRAPRALAHAGSFNCRRIRGSSHQLSEHALGNAIDLRGFDFYGARSSEPLPARAPSALLRSFRIRVLDHWDADSGVDAYHADFFAHLRARLLAEPNLFHVMLGPSFPGHRNHLHLDRAPWRFVQF